MNNKTWAFTYSKNGFSVFPTRGKKPFLEWEKYQHEKPTEDQVKQWWDRWPDADIGIATGAVSGIVVVDVDGGEVPPLPLTAIVETSPGHYQYYFAHPGFPVANSTKMIAPNCDIRGDGGFVVAPPSWHFNKNTGQPDYKYVWKITPKETGFAVIPEWVLQKIKVRSQSEPVDFNKIYGTLDGARDNNLYRAACSLLAKDLPSELTYKFLLFLNTSFQPPKSEKFVRQKFESAVKWLLAER